MHEKLGCLVVCQHRIAKNTGYMQLSEIKEKWVIGFECTCKKNNY